MKTRLLFTLVAIFCLSIFNNATADSVDLTTFTAKKQGCDIRLNWTAFNEFQHNVYVIERSKDGSSFREIGRVEARGTFGEFGQKYTFLDRRPIATNVYRLKMVSTSGHITVSREISIRKDCVTVQDEFLIRPNTVTSGNGIIMVSAVWPNDHIKMSIMDMSGRYVKEVVLGRMSGKSEQEVDVRDLTPGMYMILVDDYPFKPQKFMILK